jgi:hypothetical protein
MRNIPYNARRRNRNIGTAKAGYGQDNRLTIPWAWADNRVFYERLVDPVSIPVTVNSISVHILVEAPFRGFVHACTVDDILRVLKLIPSRHLEQIKLFVLRQPKRKERILSSVWGRLVYWAYIGVYSGPAVYLDAQNLDRPLKWDKSLKPGCALELERLRQDGFSIRSGKRNHVIDCTLSSVRNYQLYRTLPHEIGHYVDYLEKVVEPSLDDIDKRLALGEKYDSRPSQEKEAFAHRYADEFRLRNMNEGFLPFDRIFNENSIKQMGMDTEWFNPNAV